MERAVGTYDADIEGSIDFDRVTVLGAGTMGPGIAAVFASSGFEVTLWCRRTMAARDGAAEAEHRRRVLVDHGLAAAGHYPIAATDDLVGALEHTGMVIEAISEDLAAKQALASEVESYVGSEVILASTTSGLDIDQISENARLPGRFLVTHFWNPAHLVPLVEVLGSTSTTPSMLNRVCTLLRRIGKHPVLLRKYVPGFLGVRLQQAVVREAVALLEAGVASAEDIDAATRLSFGARFPVLGPLETSDLGGLDVLAAIHEYLLKDLDCSQEPQPTLRAMVSAGNLGAKTGRGFYDWSTRDAGDLARRRDEELIARVRALRARGDL